MELKNIIKEEKFSEITNEEYIFIIRYFLTYFEGIQWKEITRIINNKGDIEESPEIIG